MDQNDIYQITINKINIQFLFDIINYLQRENHFHRTEIKKLRQEYRLLHDKIFKIKHDSFTIKSFINRSTKTQSKNEILFFKRKYKRKFMSEIIQYVSLGIGLTGVVYSSLVHFLHKNTNKTNDINQTIKFQNIDQNINSIKELFQKIIKSNLFQEIKTEAKDIENQIKEKIGGITNFEYDKIKDVVQNEKSINRETVTKVSNMLQLSQNIQNHIETQQQYASNNRLQTINRKTQDQKISIYEISNQKQ